MYGDRPSLNDRPSSRASTPGCGGRPARRPATPLEQVAQMEEHHLQQVRKEVEHAATRVYEEEVRDYRQLVLNDRKQRTAELEASHRSDVVERNRQALAHRVDRTRLQEDEVYLDRRLHEAMETKLGRLTYLREHARVQRVLATTRSLIRRKESEKQRQATLQELVASCGAKDALHRSRGSASVSPQRTSSPHKDVAGKAAQRGASPPPGGPPWRAATPSPSRVDHHRQMDIGARQRTVDRLVAREDQQRGFVPKPRHSGLPHQQRPGGVHGMTSIPVGVASASHDGRPLSRSSLPGDDVDWGGPTGDPPTVGHVRPASRQSQPPSSAGSYRPQAGSRQSSAASIVPRAGGNAKPLQGSHGVGAASGTPTAVHARYMEHTVRPRLLLPPLPALIDPQSQQQQASTVSATHPPLPRPSSVASRTSGSATPIVDPFPEDTAHAFQVMATFREQHTTLRRPNSRSLEDQRMFEKHSMRFLGDLILGRTNTPTHARSKRIGSPQHQRRQSPMQRPPSSDLVDVSGGVATRRIGDGATGPVRHLPRTVRAASSSIATSVAGMCPPMSNGRGELDAFEVHQARRMQDEAVTWLQLFGKHRAKFQPRRLSQDDDAMPASDEEEEEEAPDTYISCGGPVYEMGDMSLPSEFDDARVHGGHWVGGRTQPVEGGQTASQAAQQDQVSPSDDHRAGQDERCAPGSGVRVSGRPHASSDDNEATQQSPPAARAVYEPPCTPQQFDMLRQQLHAHHGGAGGDVTSHRPNLRNAGHTTRTAALEDNNRGEGTLHQVRSPKESVLPRVEPDFSFENFFVGSFETQDIQPCAPSTSVAAPKSSTTGPGDGNDEDDLFPAPPANSSRFEDFGSSSSDDDEYDDDDVESGYGEAQEQTQEQAQADQAQAEEESYSDEDADDVSDADDVDVDMMATQNDMVPSPATTERNDVTPDAAAADATVGSEEALRSLHDPGTGEGEADGGALSGEATCATTTAATCAGIDRDAALAVSPATQPSESAAAAAAAATTVAHALVDQILCAFI